MKDKASNYDRVLSSFTDTQNKTLEAEYTSLKDSYVVTKTHYIGQRFENIYIDKYKFTNLPKLLEEAITHASEILNTKQKIKVGFWFNEMRPGHRTSAHTHDEDDELLSGVYYVNVPENSGNLILGDDILDPKNEMISIMPERGEFIFFSPKLVHSVNENKSLKTRLSIGMNFGRESSQH